MALPGLKMGPARKDAKEFVGARGDKKPWFGTCHSNWDKALHPVH